MKIRQGFVSNSSSTSFCIYGASFDCSEIKKWVDPKSEEDFPQYEKFQKKAGKVGLEFYHDYEQERAWLGRAADTIGDDETGRQFRESTEKKISTLVGKDVPCHYHTEEISS